ncbi:TIGR01777 family protein [Nocardioides oleivorans]|uniref:TIGR01777 family protein n=1 Tax=Nocardioides oleivorans TaxID=273676 RepID=A0A4V1RKE8_9ACTN|nr:TIGR01777 family oxidoreductase [Nocardioides oleivorans]RYB92032.1 TIGR01777 family protein [Nocardioides oleivorans]
MRVVIAGASGFLGTHLSDHLRVQGHEVTALVRRAPSSAHESQWDPAAGEVDASVISRADAVVNLAGASIANNPHSKKYAREVMDSRVSTTRLLASTIAASERPPAFLAGNGISIYGDHGDAVVTEETESVGDALLTRVAREWQDATEPAKAAGSRVCVLRTAPVMDRSAPPLKQLALLFKLGGGAKLGSGEQYMPMISLRDWVGAVTFLIGSRDVSGVFNLCCPRTPTNAEFTNELASAVHRKAFLAVPAPLMKVAAGDMAPELLGSVNARPAALERAGYDFEDEDVREVVSAALS